jgi:alkylation response protein AidB-like acyl-CoA dehydrogenase
MMFRLDDEHEELRALTHDIAAKEIAPRAAEVDDSGEFPHRQVRTLVLADLHAVCIPVEYGGPGGDHLASAVVAETVAGACATTQQVVGANELFAWPLLLAGSADLKSRYLPRIASGDALGAFALSEPDAGSDIVAITTRAVRDGDGDAWRLRGTKRWITNAGEANLYVVFAVTDPEARSRSISAFVVEDSDAGLSFGALERKMGIRGSPTREVYLDDIRIADDRMVGRAGDGLGIALGTLDRTRSIVAAQAVGLAQGALDVAVDYLKHRKQFGRPLADFQGLQFMLADMDMRVRAARLLTYAAAEEADRGGPDMGAAGAAAKCFASDTAMSVTTDAVQLLGGAGYVKDFPVERMMRDAKITQIYEGTNQIQRIVIARALVGDRRRARSQ